MATLPICPPRGFGGSLSSFVAVGWIVVGSFGFFPEFVKHDDGDPLRVAMVFPDPVRGGEWDFPESLDRVRTSDD